MTRQRFIQIAGAAVLAMVALVLVLWVIQSHGRNPVSASNPTITPTAISTPGVNVGCDKGTTGEFSLDESLHGQNGKILNSGAQDNASILEAAKHDPFVLRSQLLDFLTFKLDKDRVNLGQGSNLIGVRDQVDKILPSVDELRCLNLRIQDWGTLNGIIAGGVTTSTTAGDIANRDGLPVDNGTVRVPNAYANNNGGVGIGASNVPVAEPVIETTLPNGAVVDHRSFCANAIFPGVPVPVVGKGALIVLKMDDHGNPVAGFHIVLEGPVTASGDTDSSGRVTFNDLTPGDYSVREIQQPGWVAVTEMQFLVKIEADHIEGRTFINRREVPPTPTNTPFPGTPIPPTATNTRVLNTPVPPSATPPPTQTAAPRPVSTPCLCEGRDTPFPYATATPGQVSDPEPTVAPPGSLPGDNPPATPRGSGHPSTPNPLFP